MSDETSLPDTGIATQPKQREETRTRRVPPYNVIIENDDHHSFEFVVQMLVKVIGCTIEKAVQFTTLAHTSGRAVVWTGTKEVAELKYDQIRSVHEVRESDGAKLGPVSCTIEPAPGG